MIVLGIETSCDETAAAVLDGGRKVLSSVVASQDEVHAPYGGVVPELASRRHLEMIVPVIRRALADAGMGLRDLDGIAVTQGPGLVGSLLVGCSAAKALAWVHGTPLVAVNHLEGHIYAAFLEELAQGSPERGVAQGTARAQEGVGDGRGGGAHRQRRSGVEMRGGLSAESGELSAER